MSLLPGQILPQDIPIGKVNEDGTVTIDKNWWLLLYNIAAQVLGTTTNGVPANPAQLLASAESDADDTDATRLAPRIDAATVLATEPLLAEPPSSPILPLLLQEEPVPMGFLGSFTGFANPSGKIELTATNGIANTAMRSDAAPPLDQSIAPTWTANHTFTVRITLQGDTALFVLNNSTPANVLVAGTVKGWTGAGTNVTDAAIAAIGTLNLYGGNASTPRIGLTATGIGFHNATPAAKPTITGSKASNAALASLLTALATYGLLTDSTT